MKSQRDQPLLKTVEVTKPVIEPPLKVMLLWLEEIVVLRRVMPEIELLLRAVPLLVLLKITQDLNPWLLVTDNPSYKVKVMISTTTKESGTPHQRLTRRLISV
jgi:hypothetical protein